MAKITKATFKSFIRKNQGRLQIKVKSDFDGMVDCVMPVNGSFKPVQPDERVFRENTQGIAGLWLVGDGGDRFYHYEDAQHVGIEYYNCCGSGIVAVQKF